jgi:hypothetical protein
VEDDVLASLAETFPGISASATAMRQFWVADLAAQLTFVHGADWRLEADCVLAHLARAPLTFVPGDLPALAAMLAGLACWRMASSRERTGEAASFGDFYSPGHGSLVAHSKPLKSKHIIVLARTLQLICGKTTGTDSGLSTEETTMNSSMNDQSTHQLIPAWRINSSVLLGVCLIALTAILFYGPVLLLLWRELR